MIDLIELKQAIKNMTRQQAIYRVIRDELKKQDHWKQKSRGDPLKGYEKVKYAKHNK